MKKRLGLAALVWASSCVKAPTVVVVDRNTALEEQIAQDFTHEEATLLREGLSPRPAAFTRGQMEKAGVVSSSSALDVVLRSYQAYSTDQQALDDLLKRRCVGEGMDGLVVQTSDTCKGSVDKAAMARLMKRTNDHRRRVMDALMRVSGNKDRKAVVQAYRRKLKEFMVCGGQYQKEDGSWEVKRCD